MGKIAKLRKSVFARQALVLLRWPSGAIPRVYFLPDAKKCHRSVREEVRGGNLRVAKENHTGDHNVHVGHAQDC